MAIPGSSRLGPRERGAYGWSGGGPRVSKHVWSANGGGELPDRVDDVHSGHEGATPDPLAVDCTYMDAADGAVPSRSPPRPCFSTRASRPFVFPPPFLSLQKAIPVRPGDGVEVGAHPAPFA